MHITLQRYGSLHKNSPKRYGNRSICGFVHILSHIET